MHYLDESHILLFLLQLFVLMGCARGFGELLRHWKQPALTAEILVGIILGPTIMGRFLPVVHSFLFPADAIQQAMLDTIAWLGVLLLLLDTGLEIDFSVAWRQRGNAFLIAISDIIIPMVVAFAAVFFLPGRYMVNPDQRLVFSLFMATVMTISALPVAARVFHDIGLLKADLGFLVMSALTVNDIIGWVLFTIILGIFTSATAAIGSIAFIFAMTVGFAALSLTLGRRLSAAMFDSLHRLGMPEPGTSLTITVLLGLLFGTFTQKLGIHALFGFFIAGVVVGEAKSVSEQTRGVISQMVHSLFVPLFFANIGLKIDFISDFDPLLVALMCGVGVFGRYLGAWIGVTLTKVPRINRDLIAIAHTPGGMMEIVVALLALEARLITGPVFVAIVFSAVFSSVLLGPWMTRSLTRRRKVTPAQFLSKDTVIPQLAGATTEDVISELAEKITESTGSLDKEVLVGGAMSREREFGTAIGNGIAIPHVRLAGIRDPALAYGHSPQGIRWNEPDGIAVEDVFFLMTPDGVNDVHVQVLACIATAMTPPQNRKRLHDARSLDDLFGILQSLLGETKAKGKFSKHDDRKSKQHT
ncbi:MAG: cation:proton antiporter [Candidatus Cloacimonetes bacterium]|nr:cation:proton antiporter [Candidatus Cloacimonadota bacterium]